MERRRRRIVRLGIDRDIRLRDDRLVGVELVRLDPALAAESDLLVASRPGEPTRSRVAALIAPAELRSASGPDCESAAAVTTVLVQNVNAPAATVEVPTLGGVGLLLLGVLLGVGGLWLARRS
jgi:hypothetical protein